MAANRLLIALTGTLITGSVSVLPATAGSAQSTPETAAPTIASLNVRADRKYTDTKSKATIAEGNVSVQLGNAELHADRIEFDATYRTLYARGAVRYRRGKQFFQASSFRYNLVQNEGQLNDVYGVIDLEEPLANPLTTSRTASAPPESPTSASREDMPAVACPPLLPPVPDWHPQPWSITAWGGQMIDAPFGDTFLFKGQMRPEALLGVGIQKRIMRAGPLAIELEADLFSHNAKQQKGGGFNQDNPYADVPPQNFSEAVLGIGARFWVQPWLSFSFVEGVSYNTEVSLYEKTFRENYTQLLNYLAFEVEAAVSSDLSLVGRIHHRSGAFGAYEGVTEGSNGYLLGLRYRWGQDAPEPETSLMPPPPECEDPDRDHRVKPSSLSDRLDSIALGDGGDSQRHASNHDTTEKQSVPPAQQQAMRTEAIAKIDQRISAISHKGNLNIERRLGIPTRQSNSSVRDQNDFGAVSVGALKKVGNKPLVDGKISRWRVQAPEIFITKDGWRANRMGFSNDPFTPTQTRIDAEDVVARNQANGDVLISARRNRLIFEERLPIPVSRRQRIQGEEDIENRWVYATDNKDRGGFFVGRDLKPIELSRNYTLRLQPQFMVQRAIDGQTSSSSELFGLEAELKGKLWGWNSELEADVSTFNPKNFFDSSRYWGQIKRDFTLPWIGEITAHLFGAYRYRAWNGSLGTTDVYAGAGGFIDQRKHFKWGKSRHRYLWRFGVGNYKAESFTRSDLTQTLRANFYGSINSSYPIWRGEAAALTPDKAYRYSPSAVIPGLSFRTNVNTQITAYGDGHRQTTVTLTGGPQLTLGTFSKPFLDYTKLSVSGGITYKQGASPFSFDQAIDLGKLGISVTQQIAGPVVLKAGVSVNVDPNSEYYKDVINSNFELSWKRRSYDFGFYFDPYKSIGGFRFRLNDFNFKGTGVPFVPYTSTNWMNTTNGDRPF